MLLISLAVAVLAMQTVPPLPGQASTAPQNGSSNIQEQGKHGGDSSAPTVPTAKPNEPKPSDGNRGNITNNNTEYNVKLTNIPTVTIADKNKRLLDYIFDWGPWVFSLLLVLVGVGGMWVAHWTRVAIDKQVGLMDKQAKLMAQQADLMQASMTQWVSVANWKASLTRRMGPLSPRPKTLVVEFEISNESNFPLTMAANFRFFGKLDNAVRFGTGQDTILFPKKPYKCAAPLNLTDEQATEYEGTGLHIAVHGQIDHIGVSKQGNYIVD